MTITVSIGDSVRTFSSRSSIEEGWINQQFQARKRDTGQDPCVKVHIAVGSLDLRLVSSACGGGGGGRPPTPAEESLIALWRELRLSDQTISGGQVVAFLKKVFGVLN